VNANQELLRIGLGSGTEIEADGLVLATDPATLRRLALESALVMMPGGNGSLGPAMRRPSPYGGCGSIDRLHPIAPPS
jgi:hypothetical protein